MHVQDDLVRSRRRNNPVTREKGTTFLSRGGDDSGSELRQQALNISTAATVSATRQTSTGAYFWTAEVARQAPVFECAVPEVVIQSGYHGRRQVDPGGLVGDRSRSERNSGQGGTEPGICCLQVRRSWGYSLVPSWMSDI